MVTDLHHIRTLIAMTSSKLLDLMTSPTWQSRSSQCKSLPPVPRWAWRCWEGVSEGAVKYVATPSCCSSLWGFFLKADFRRTVSTATVRIHCTLGQTVSCRSRNRWQQPCRGEKRLKFERRKFHHAKEMCYNLWKTPKMHLFGPSTISDFVTKKYVKVSDSTEN